LPQFGLGGRFVRLEPLSPAHVDDLTQAATLDRSSYRFTVVPDGRSAMARYVEELTAAREAGEVIPFAQCRVDHDELIPVGCTRFMNLRRWRGRPEPDEVEIGGTWLAADVQRTRLNTEAKLLLLTHAFETWGVWRVEFCTDARNERSRDAIVRLGASFEGVLRNHRLASDAPGRRPRDSAVFSVTDEDWPAVQRRLRERLSA